MFFDLRSRPFQVRYGFPTKPRCRNSCKLFSTVVLFCIFRLRTLHATTVFCSTSCFVVFKQEWCSFGYYCTGIQAEWVQAQVVVVPLLSLPVPCSSPCPSPPARIPAWWVRDRQRLRQEHRDRERARANIKQSVCLIVLSRIADVGERETAYKQYCCKP